MEQISNHQVAVGIGKSLDVASPDIAQNAHLEGQKASVVERVGKKISDFHKSRLPGEKTRKGMDVYDKVLTNLPETPQKIAKKIRPVVRAAMYAGNTYTTVGEILIVSAVVGGGAYLLKERITNPDHFHKVIKNISTIPKNILKAVSSEIDYFRFSPRDWLKNVSQGKPTSDSHTTYDQITLAMRERFDLIRSKGKSLYQQIISGVGRETSPNIRLHELVKILQSSSSAEDGVIPASLKELIDIVYQPFGNIIGAPDDANHTWFGGDVLTYGAINYYYSDPLSPQSQALHSALEQITNMLPALTDDHDTWDFCEQIIRLAAMGTSTKREAGTLLMQAREKLTELTRKHYPMGEKAITELQRQLNEIMKPEYTGMGHNIATRILDQVVKRHTL